MENNKIDTTGFGLSLLESLTVAMYPNPDVCYREYIQNSCDSINRAVKEGVIKFEDAWIDVVIDPEKRYVSIEDNGLGLGKQDFYRTMVTIAASQKKQGEDMGFRGIGRLVGMAFCKTLKFSASSEGEDVTSIFTWDGKKLQEMLQNNYDGPLGDAIVELVSHSTQPADPSERFFKVEMLDVFETTPILLDEEKICDYLQFVLPVDYNINFDLARDIHNYAKEVNDHMEEHNVMVNGRSLTKAFYRDLLDKNGNVYDRIESLYFHQFKNSKGELLAWMWYGLSSFEKQIPEENKIRGIALRSANIQLGDNKVFQPYFREERAYAYFVGEVFAVHQGLRPNARRDFFNPCDTLNEFLAEIEKYFHGDLRKLFNKANRIKNSIRDVNAVAIKEQEHQDKLTGKVAKGYRNDKDIEKGERELEIAKEKANTAVKELEKLDKLDPDSPLGKVAQNVQKRHKKEIPSSLPKIVPVSQQQTTEETVLQVPETPPQGISDHIHSQSAEMTKRSNVDSVSILSPKKDEISMPSPLPAEPVTLPEVPQEPVKPVLFADTLTKLKEEEKSVFNELLNLVETVVKEREMDTIMDKIIEKWK